MASYVASVPALAEFFPPTPKAWKLMSNVFKLVPFVSTLQWTPIRAAQAMGKTSIMSGLNLPGRHAWSVAEAVGPINMIFILFMLPQSLKPTPTSSSSFLGTGLPQQLEIMGALYVLHYLNRAVITPQYLAPSMSPIHAGVALSMAVFQFINSSNIACWLVYSTLVRDSEPKPLISMTSILGMLLFITGYAGNVIAENKLFSLRRGAAKRKAKSEGRATVTYDKVYVVPPAEGLFKQVLYPHYSLEWIEWIGYWVLGGAWGLGWGWKSAALWFLIAEVATMLPRAVKGVNWYEGKFGKRAVGGRHSVLPGLL